MRPIERAPRQGATKAGLRRATAGEGSKAAKAAAKGDYAAAQAALESDD